MYRRLKNILGVSLMVLAIVISQVPMPEAQAEIVKEMTEEDLQVDDASAHVVTFSMNGGTFRGNYNGYSFQGKTPVLVIDDGKTISSFPDDKLASYSGYKTEANTWYTDKECLTKYDAGRSVTQSTTLYKKWYNITSDGDTLADRGFHISADRTVLYRYDGEEALVEIPQTVTIIADGAFDGLDQKVRGITLPAGIKSIGENAFGGVNDTGIIYIYDSGTTASKDYGKRLAEKYEQLVYSEYLDPEKTEEIAGINYLSDSQTEEDAETPEGSTNSSRSKASSEENDSGQSDTGMTSNDTGAEDGDAKTDEGGTGTTESGTEPEESDTGTSDHSEETDESDAETPDHSEETDESDIESEESESQVESSEEAKESFTIDPDKGYTVTFDTGISGISGEKREVFYGKKVSEEVSVDGNPAKILRIGIDKIKKDDGKGEEITYTFKGWYKDNACTEKWDFSKDVIDDDTTIYADWDEETRSYFYVTYQAAKGNESAANIPSKQKLYEDEKLEKPAPDPSLTNKTFKGWYTSETGAGSAYTSWGKPVTEDMTLYAHFEEKTNTVIFHMNGGGYTGTYNGTTYTDVSSLKAEIPAGRGISSSEYPGGGSSSGFKYSNYTTDSNWYKDKECLEVYAQRDSSGKDTVLSGNLTLYKKWYYTSSGFTMNFSNNVLYKYSGSVADVIIPNSVTIIGTDAFASVGGISSITLPDNISEVKENAFSGVNNVSKDIVITGISENARNVAKGLANQYARLVYKDSGTSGNDADENSIVSRAAAGSIKLGATIAGSIGTAGNGAAVADSTQSTADSALSAGTITLGAGGVSTTTGTQPAASGQSVVVSQNTASPAQQGSSASVSQGTKTTQKQNITSASAPKSTQHIKDSTPKTGDPLQYRMLIVCAMFSVGVLLVLTGNGKKKKVSAS